MNSLSRGLERYCDTRKKKKKEKEKPYSLCLLIMLDIWNTNKAFHNEKPIKKKKSMDICTDFTFYPEGWPHFPTRDVFLSLPIRQSKSDEKKTKTIGFKQKNPPFYLSAT